MKKTLRPALLATVLALVACGDPDTNDARGYTKAPTEDPGWTIDAEQPTEMSELGDPIRVPAMDTLAEETAAPGPPAAPVQPTNPPSSPQPAAGTQPAQ